MGDHKEGGVEGPGFLQEKLKFVNFFLIDFKRGNQRKIDDIRFSDRRKKEERKKKERKKERKKMTAHFWNPTLLSGRA